MSRLDLNAGHSEEYIDKLSKQGLVINKSVTLDLPQLPADISSVSDGELMALFSQITAFTNFLNTQLSCAEIDERRAEKNLGAVEDHAMIREHSGKAAKDTVTFLKTKIAADPEVMKAREDYESKYAYRKLIDSMADNASRDAMLVSRELTRRTAGSNANTRGQRMFA